MSELKCAKEIFKKPSDCLPSIVAHYGHELITCGCVNGETWSEILCKKCNESHTLTEEGWE